VRQAQWQWRSTREDVKGGNVKDAVNAALKGAANVAKDVLGTAKNGGVKVFVLKVFILSIFKARAKPLSAARQEPIPASGHLTSS